MNALNIQKRELAGQDGAPLRLVYDEEGDILEIFYGETGRATGVELTDHIILRLSKEEKRALSLILLHFSILSEHTEYGPRSFPLDKLDGLPDEVRELVLALLTTPPVNQFLKLSHLHLSPVKSLPIVYVEPQPIVVDRAQPSMRR